MIIPVRANQPTPRAMVGSRRRIRQATLSMRGRSLRHSSSAQVRPGPAQIRHHDAPGERESYPPRLLAGGASEPFEADDQDGQQDQAANHGIPPRKRHRAARCRRVRRRQAKTPATTTARLRRHCHGARHGQRPKREQCDAGEHQSRNGENGSTAPNTRGECDGRQCQKDNKRREIRYGNVTPQAFDRPATQRTSNLAGGRGVCAFCYTVSRRWLWCLVLSVLSIRHLHRSRNQPVSGRRCIIGAYHNNKMTRVVKVSSRRAPRIRKSPELRSSRKGKLWIRSGAGHRITMEERRRAAGSMWVR